MERPEEPDVRRDQTEDHDANSDGGATPRRGGGEGRGGGDGPGRREAPEGCPESISGCPTPRNPVPGRTHARVFQPVLVLRRVDGPVARRTLGRSTRDASFRNRGGCPRVGNPSKPIRSRAAGGRARARDGALRRHGLRRRARDGLRRGGRQSSRVFRGTLRGRRRRKRKTRGRCGCGVATRGRARSGIGMAGASRGGIRMATTRRGGLGRRRIPRGGRGLRGLQRRGRSRREPREAFATEPLVRVAVLRRADVSL